MALSCTMYNVDNTLKPFFNEILSLPQLRRCELHLSQNASNLPDFNSNLPISNSLRHFRLNASISSASLCHLVRFMPSLRILDVHLYRHNRDDWYCLSSLQMTKRACKAFIGSHLVLEDLVKSAPKLIYLYTDIEPYDNLFYRILCKQHNLDDCKISNIHMRMAWKKNPISHMLDIRSPVIIQGQKCLQDKGIVGQCVYDY